MKLEQKLTAPQLAVLTIAGSLLLYASFWYAIRLSGHHPTGCECPSFWEVLWTTRYFLLSWLTPLLLGAWAMYGGLAAFKRGIDEDLYNQATRDKLLRQLKPRIWTWIAAILAAPGVAFMLFVLFQGFDSPFHKYAGMGGMLFFTVSPLYGLGMLRSHLKPKRDPLSPIRRTIAPEWYEITPASGSLKPLHSDHWGERNA